MRHRRQGNGNPVRSTAAIDGLPAVATPQMIRTIVSAVLNSEGATDLIPIDFRINAGMRIDVVGDFK